MAITTLSDLYAAPRQTLGWSKATGAVVQSPLQWMPAWLMTGFPAPPSAPAMGVAGATLSDADAGSLGSFVNPASGLTAIAQIMLSIADVGNVGPAISAIMLYDRLWHNSSLSPTLTTSQTVGSVTLPARCPMTSDPTGRTFDTNGNGVEAWWDVTTVMGAGTVAPTISYTDEAGNAGATATVQGWSTGRAANTSLPFDLVAGDRGVRSIQSYQQAATQTSGAFSLVLRRRLVTVRTTTRSVPTPVDWSELGMAVPDNTCLEVLVAHSGAGGTVSLAGTLTLVHA